MNLHVLHPNIAENFNMVYPAINSVFVQTAAAAKTATRGINAQPFLARLNTALTGSKIRVFIEWTKKYGDPHQFSGNYYPAIGGYCFCPTEQYSPARIHMFLCLHPSTRRLTLSPPAWNYFHYRFLKTVTHELVHRAQFANRHAQSNMLVFRPHSSNLSAKMLKQQKYLGDIDEVEAYARDCVEEWYYLNPTVPLTLREIKSQFRNEGGILPSAQYYYETYVGDENHPSVQRFFRKIKVWNDIVTPLAQLLPQSPDYVRQNASENRGILFG